MLLTVYLLDLETEMMEGKAPLSLFEGKSNNKNRLLVQQPMNNDWGKKKCDAMVVSKCIT